MALESCWSESQADMLKNKYSKEELIQLHEVMRVVEQVVENNAIREYLRKGGMDPEVVDGILLQLVNQNYARITKQGYFTTPLGYSIYTTLHDIVVKNNYNKPNDDGYRGLPSESVFNSVYYKYLYPIEGSETIVTASLEDDVLALLVNKYQVNTIDSQLPLTIRPAIIQLIKNVWLLWQTMIIKPLPEVLDYVIETLPKSSNLYYTFKEAERRRGPFEIPCTSDTVSITLEGLTANTSYSYRLRAVRKTYYEQLKEKRRNEPMQFLRVNKTSGLLRMDCILSVDPEYEKKDNAEDIKDLETEIAKLNEKVAKQSGEFQSDSTNPVVIQMEAQSFIAANTKLTEVVNKLTDLKARREALDSEYTGRVRYSLVYDHPVEKEQIEYSTDWFPGDEEGDAWLAKFNYIETPMEKSI